MSYAVAYSLSGRTLIAILPLIALVLCLIGFSLVRLWRSDSVPYLPRWAWTALILLVTPGTVVDAGSLTVRHTEVRLGPSAEPDAQAIFRVQLAGRMCYGQIEVRWR